MNTEDVKLLYVDDDDHARVLLKTMLQSINCEKLFSAANGQEAVEIYEKEMPDLVILDIEMPEKNGKEALKEIIAVNENAKIVMWSSLESEDNIRECMELGAINFIRKYEKMDVFSEIISAIIEEL